MRHSNFKHSFCFLLSSLIGATIMCMMHHLKLPHSPQAFFCFLHNFFSLCISVQEVFIGISTSSVILSSSIASLLMSPSKEFFIFITVFLVQHFLLILSQSLHLFAYINHLFLHVVYFFCMKSLKMFVIVILISLSVNSNISIVYESGFDVFFLFRLFPFAFWHAL